MNYEQFSQSTKNGIEQFRNFIKANRNEIRKYNLYRDAGDYVRGFEFVVPTTRIQMNTGVHKSIFLSKLFISCLLLSGVPNQSEEIVEASKFAQSKNYWIDGDVQPI